ncbi:hypothetical protein GCM10010123_33470 [Pilimelia anulata]|uniref:Uncharacterized protein n=1 Tax=Pilimelia anulata TaxID=53371 RepID=A0A8J3BB16_9ACTN|nr:hypothetical protein GCM10010123_33470 [Pilimelia anulata]
MASVLPRSAVRASGAIGYGSVLINWSPVPDKKIEAADPGYGFRGLKRAEGLTIRPAYFEAELRAGDR